MVTRRHLMFGLVVLVVAALPFALGHFSSLASMAGSDNSSPTVSPAERDALDQITRRDIADMRRHVGYKPLLPSSLPVGYTYAHLNWDGNPQDGFNLFISSAVETRAIHLLEGRGPIPPNKDTKLVFASSLKPTTIAGKEWLMMQKPNEPWQGEWIFIGDIEGFRLEVDGLAPPTVLVQFIESLG